VRDDGSSNLTDKREKTKMTEGIIMSWIREGKKWLDI
jgi:hypothetical protein